MSEGSILAKLSKLVADLEHDVLRMRLSPVVICLMSWPFCVISAACKCRQAHVNKVLHVIRAACAGHRSTKRESLSLKKGMLHYIYDRKLMTQVTPLPR